MVDTNELVRFVESIFDRYHAIKLDFFSQYDKELDDSVDKPLYLTGTEDDWMLKRLSVHLGMDKQEILNMDKNAARRYAEKYPFFRLYNEYLRRWEFCSLYKGEAPSPKEHLLLAIFGKKSGIPTEPRYYKSNIKTRLNKKLKEIDAAIPGTYHKGAKITNLHVETEIFFSFPQCPEMIRSFNTMVARLKELFFKALDSDLCKDEMHELNFLASWFHAGDLVKPSLPITYKTICQYRDLYKKENYSDFFSYVRLRRFNYAGLLWQTSDFIPWRCMEFFEDMDAVQDFCDIFPSAKTAMRDFAMKVTNYYCWFNWSDAMPIEFSPEEELELSYMYEEDELIPLESRAKEPTEIYVEKTPAEMPGWEKYVERLRRAASPEKMGGIRPAYRDPRIYDQTEVINRIKSRVGYRF